MCLTVVVDDVGHGGNIKTARRDVGSNHDGGLPALECFQCCFTLELSAIAVDGRGVESLQVEPRLEGVGAALRLDEDEGQAFNKSQLPLDVLLLLVVAYVYDVLFDGGGRGADTTDSEEQVVVEKV